MITLYLNWDRPSNPAARIGEAEHGELAAVIRGIPGLVRGLVYTPASAHDPYLNDGPPPPLAVQLYFGDVAAMEAACGRDGPLQALAGPKALSSLAGAQVTQQAMLARSFPVDEPSAAADPICTYLVTYPGPADDLNLWLDHYIAHHPAIMRRFPGIRGIEIDTRIDATSFLPFEPVSHIQRNKTIFDSPEALNAALNSPVRHDMRADFHSFPPFSGGTTHFPMLTWSISP